MQYLKSFALLAISFIACFHTTGGIVSAAVSQPLQTSTATATPNPQARRLCFDQSKVFWFKNSSAIQNFQVVSCAQGIKVENNQLVLQQLNSNCGGTLMYPNYIRQGGMWDMQMQVAPSQGIISAFCLYGQEILTGGKADELDYEVSNLTPQIAQSMYYVKGERVLGDEYQYNIKTPDQQIFSNTKHIYGIEYNQDYVNWWMDGQIRRTVYKGVRNKFPADVGLLRFGVWDGSASSGAWAGTVSDWSRGPFNMYIDWIRFTPYC
ncbi:hypothetical protein EV182_002424 [Spiromyces aspiralis]|uniref:Uncharacterized protein n=1 Tax=Spiromyces aspiralis TaxID=68401 RepID=A0ACC1HZD8_9FUNG|nr:hypothetical protein EV182_002424 [Spiromyces aspiralis]